MTTGNSAAMTMNAAGMAPPDISQTKCEELDLKNKDERGKAIEGMKGSDSDSAGLKGALSKAEGGGMTFSSASVSVGAGGGRGISGVATGCSNAKAKECTSGSLVEGGSGGMKTGQESILCPEADYSHAAGGSGAHAEAKIMNELSQMANSAGGSVAGGSMLIKVDWRFKQPDGNVYGSGMPCRSCYRMMCKASKDCKIAIFLCDGDNKPQPLGDDCDQDDGDPDGPYAKLDQRMGEHPYKGTGLIS